MKPYHNMLRIYISHPFSGDEKENRRRANNIAWALTMKYPDTLFINPLDAMRHAEYAALSYEQVLEFHYMYYDFAIFRLEKLEEE